MACSPPGSSVHRISQAEYWSGLPFSSPGSLPDPGIEPMSLALQVDSLTTELSGQPYAGFTTSKIFYQHTVKYVLLIFLSICFCFIFGLRSATLFEKCE